MGGLSGKRRSLGTKRAGQPGKMLKEDKASGRVGSVQEGRGDRENKL